MKLKYTGKPYTPNSAHNQKSWQAILDCLAENNGQASKLKLIGCIKDHPEPTTSKIKNAERHIDWHIRLGRLAE